MIELTIDDYPVYMRLGCFAAEQLAGQRILVSLKMHYFAPERDKLVDTLDYGGVIASIDDCLKNTSMQLLESAVGNLGDHLMIEYPQLQRAEVVIQKTVLPGDLNKGAHIKMKRIFSRS